MRVFPSCLQQIIAGFKVTAAQDSKRGFQPCPAPLVQPWGSNQSAGHLWFKGCETSLRLLEAYTLKYHLFLLSYMKVTLLWQKAVPQKVWLVLEIQGSLAPFIASVRIERTFLHQALFSLFVPVWGKSLTLTEQMKIKPAMGKANYVPHCLGMDNLICSWQWFDGLSHPFSDPAFQVIFIVNQWLQCRTLSIISVTMTNSHISVSDAARVFPPILHCLTFSGKCWMWYTVALSLGWALGRTANGSCERDGAKQNGTITEGHVSNLFAVILSGMANLAL